MHGRNPKKLEAAVAALATTEAVDTFTADLSRMPEVEALAEAVTQKHPRLDVLINNAGIFGTPDPITEDGLDVRFAVNTIAPYLLTQRLLPSMDRSGRVVNLSSARTGPRRCAGTGRTGPSVRQCGLRPKQAGADHVVSQHGADAQRKWTGGRGGQSGLVVGQQNGQTGLRNPMGVICLSGPRYSYEPRSTMSSGRRPGSISTMTRAALRLLIRMRSTRESRKRSSMASRRF